MSIRRKAVFDQAEVSERYRSAFPHQAVVDLNAVLEVLPAAPQLPSADDIGSVVVSGESLRIPMRIYSPEPRPEAVERLSGSARVVLSCLFTRHHDGFVRERHLLPLFASEATWVPPFVLQLLGEYVVQITEVVLRHLDQLRNDRYASFAASNEGFIQKVRHRAISYWDCYYHSMYPEFREYPAFQVMEGLALWDKHDARRKLAR